MQWSSYRQPGCANNAPAVGQDALRMIKTGWAPSSEALMLQEHG